MSAPARLKTPADLVAARAAIRTARAAQEGGGKHRLLVCTGSGCVACGAWKVIEALRAEIAAAKLDAEVVVVGTGCRGRCAGGPLLTVAPELVFYQQVQPSDAADIVRGHLAGGKPVDRLLWEETPGAGKKACLSEIDYFNRQTRIVLRNCGHVDPRSISDYIAADGYAALAKVLTGMDPEAVIAEVDASGLRGRGGAGFPTGRKWAFARASAGPLKYILCNADEGDPGAFMDRSVLEGDPHSVLEGMAIGARAIGATEGYVYVRAEYALAVERLEQAIAEARAAGILGEDILGSGFSFDVDIRKGSGAFVCGEETALIHSIEGKRGEPRPRPPFPAQKGLWGKPSCLNNVETFANVPSIILNGGKWFAAYGTETSRGTKIFALAGAVQVTGLVEVAMGTSLRELVFGVGGGVPAGRTFKAAQVGGPSGGCIPAAHLDTPMDYESLGKLGAIMGSGGLIVMDDTSCMVDVARFFLEFTQDESCGKCTPCREGTARMLEILQRICAGEGAEEDIPALERLADTVKNASLCGLGQTAPNPVLSTLRHFRAEYEEHIRERRCRAKVCRALFKVVISDRCTGCTACARACPAKAISGKAKERHAIDAAACTRCGLCLGTCKFGAIAKE